MTVRGLRQAAAAVLLTAGLATGLGVGVAPAGADTGAPPAPAGPSYTTGPTMPAEVAPTFTTGPTERTEVDEAAVPTRVATRADRHSARADDHARWPWLLLLAGGGTVLGAFGLRARRR